MPNPDLELIPIPENIRDLRAAIGASLELPHFLAPGVMERTIRTLTLVEDQLQRLVEKLSLKPATN